MTASLAVVVLCYGYYFFIFCFRVLRALCSCFFHGSISAVTVDSKFSSFDPFIKVTTVAEDGMLRAEDAAAASASDGSATADVPQKFVRRTRVLKNTQQPVWREDFFLGALEYDDLLRLELKLKSKDQGQKTLPNPNLCSVVFSCGDVLDTLGRLDPGEGRVKFQLSGEKASAVLTCVATFDSDVPLVLSALLPPPADARDGKAANRNSGRITSNSNLATACGGNVLSAHCYVSLNHNHTAMLLASEPLVRKAQHD